MSIIGLPITLFAIDGSTIFNPVMIVETAEENFTEGLYVIF